MKFCSIIFTCQSFCLQEWPAIEWILICQCNADHHTIVNCHGDYGQPPPQPIPTWMSCLHLLQHTTRQLNSINLQQQQILPNPKENKWQHIISNAHVEINDPTPLDMVWKHSILMVTPCNHFCSYLLKMSLKTFKEAISRHYTSC